MTRANASATPAQSRVSRLDAIKALRIAAQHVVSLFGGVGTARTLQFACVGIDALVEDGDHAVPFDRVVGGGVGAEDGGGGDPLGVHREDPIRDVAAHGKATVEGSFDAEVVQDLKDVRAACGEGVVRDVMRLVALAVATGVDSDELVVVAQGIDIAVHAPMAKRTAIAVMEDERWSAAFDVIVNANSVVIGVGHRLNSLDSIQFFGSLGAEATVGV